MEREELKIGMLVKIVKRNLGDCNEGKHGIRWTPSMDKYDGKIMVNESTPSNGCACNGYVCIDGWNWDLDWLEPVDELEYLKEGQILYNEEEDEYVRVLAKLGGTGEMTTYQMSEFSYNLTSNGLKSGGPARTAYQLKEDGYKPYNTEPNVEELTMDELCKELGRTVKIKK